MYSHTIKMYNRKTETITKLQKLLVNFKVPYESKKLHNKSLAYEDNENNGIDITTVKHAQSTTFYKTTTRLRRPMLSPPKQILIQSLRPPV